MSQGSPIQVPVCLAMIVADNLHRDLGNGKMYILGTFSCIFSASFPAAHPSMAVYVLLTDGRGPTSVALKLVRLCDDSDDVTIAEQEDSIDFTDGRMVFELGVLFTYVEFPQAGEYRLQLLCGNELVAERRLLAVHVREPDEGSEIEGA